MPWGSEQEKDLPKINGVTVSLHSHSVRTVTAPEKITGNRNRERERGETHLYKLCEHKTTDAKVTKANIGACAYGHVGFRHEKLFVRARETSRFGLKLPGATNSAGCYSDILVLGCKMS